MTTFVSLRMTYTPVEGERRSERFCFYNDTMADPCHIDALKELPVVQGAIQAPMYGLPQLAKFDFDSQLPHFSDDNHHCYSEVSEIKLVLNYDADAPLMDGDVILNFSPIFSALTNDKPVQNWHKRVKEHSIEMMKYHIAASRDLTTNLPGNKEILSLLDSIEENLEKQKQ
jgi:hypothetical protein